MASFGKHMDSYFALPLVGVALAVILTVVGWKLNPSSANASLVVAWLLLIASIFRIIYGISMVPLIPSILWTLLIGAIVGLSLYYALWTDDKLAAPNKAQIPASSLTVTSAVPSGKNESEKVAEENPVGPKLANFAATNPSASSLDSDTALRETIRAAKAHKKAVEEAQRQAEAKCQQDLLAASSALFDSIIKTLLERLDNAAAASGDHVSTDYEKMPDSILDPTGIIPIASIQMNQNWNITVKLPLSGNSSEGHSDLIGLNLNISYGNSSGLSGLVTFDKDRNNVTFSVSDPNAGVLMNQSCSPDKTDSYVKTFVSTFYNAQLEHIRTTSSGAK